MHFLWIIISHNLFSIEVRTAIQKNDKVTNKIVGDFFEKLGDFLEYLRAFSTKQHVFFMRQPLFRSHNHRTLHFFAKRLYKKTHVFSCKRATDPKKSCTFAS